MAGARLIVGHGPGAGAVFSWLAKPVVAGVIFNAFVMISHIPGVVNSVGAERQPLHYALHLLLVLVGAADVDAGVRAVPGAAAWAPAAR